MTVLLDPTSERSPTIRPRLSRPESLDGLTVGILDIAKARGEGLGPEQEAGPVLPTLNTAINRLLDRNTRFEASAAVCPTGQSADAAWAALEEAGNCVRDALKAGNGLALGSRFLPHRVFGQMSLNYYFAFVGAHEARHAIQIREIAKEMSVVE